MEAQNQASQDRANYYNSRPTAPAKSPAPSAKKKSSKLKAGESSPGGAAYWGRTGRLTPVQDSGQPVIFLGEKCTAEYGECTEIVPFVPSFGDLARAAVSAWSWAFGGSSAAAPAAEGAANFTRALQASDFGAKATVEVIEGTLSVQNKVATVGIKYIQGNLGNPITALNALKATAVQAGATTLRIEATIANPQLGAALTRFLGPATQGAVGGAQDIWILAL